MKTQNTFAQPFFLFFANFNFPGSKRQIKRNPNIRNQNNRKNPSQRTSRRPPRSQKAEHQKKHDHQGKARKRVTEKQIVDVRHS